jgi:hypothetical protein
VTAVEDTFHQLIPGEWPPAEPPTVEVPPMSTFPPEDPPLEPNAPPGVGELLNPGVDRRGLINGTGATARSGRVKVFPLLNNDPDCFRKVAPTGRVS